MIDEKKLIAEIRDAINDDRYKGYKPAAVLYELWDMITGQPKIGEWIPCSERLPGNSKYETYLCTLDGELCGMEDPFTGMCGFENGKWDEGDCVIAWQPLPEPWEGETK